MKYIIIVLGLLLAILVSVMALAHSEVKRAVIETLRISNDQEFSIRITKIRLSKMFGYLKIYYETDLKNDSGNIICVRWWAFKGANLLNYTPKR
jgi:hypothetical protein